MPTVTETLQTVRGAATVNGAALASVRIQAAGALDLVEAWPNSPNKGRVRDQLARLAAAYDRTKVEAQRLVAIATAALESSGPLDPDPTPAAITWSTADF